MLQQTGNFFAPPDLGDETLNREAELLHWVSIAVFSTGVLGVLAGLLARGTENYAPVLWVACLAILLFIVVAQVLLRARYLVAAQWVVTGLLWGLVTFLVFAPLGVSQFALTLYVVTAVIAFTLLGASRGWVFVGLSLLSLAVAFLFYQTAVFPDLFPTVADPIGQFVTGFVSLLAVSAVLFVLLRHYHIITETNRRLQEETQILEISLEGRVLERTENLSLATDINRRLSQLRDPNILISQAVELIRSQFDLYYVQVYLYDESTRSLDLAAGTGVVGEELVRRNHRLPIGTGSINGSAAVRRETIIVSNTKDSGIFRFNPLLPETRSEASLPIIVDRRLIGVLNVQSQKFEGVSSDNIPAFEAIAAQLATSVENARFFNMVQNTQAELQVQARRFTRDGWSNFLDAIERDEFLGYSYAEQALKPLDAPISPDENEVQVNIELAGEQIGTIQLVGDFSDGLSADEEELVTAIARQIANQVETLRLLEEAEKYRVEVETASRQQLRAGWETYQKNEQQALGFGYDMHRVHSLEENGAVQVTQKGLQAPLMVKGEPIGDIAFAELAEADEETSSLVSTVITQLGNHIENLRLSRQTERALAVTEEQAERLAELNRLSRELNLITTEEEIFALILANVSNLVQAEQGSLALLSEDQTLVDVWQFNEANELTTTMTGLPLAEMWLRTAVAENQIITHPDITQENNYLDPQFMSSQGVRSIMVAPIRVEGRVIGTLNIGTVVNNYYRDRDQNLMQQLTSLLSSSIENRRLTQRTADALKSTENLYNAGRFLNEASDLQEVTAGIPLAIPTSGINRALLLFADYNTQNEIDAFTVVGRWASDSSLPLVDLNTRFVKGESQLFSAQALAATEPVYIETVHTDVEEPAIQRAFESLAVEAAVILPLFVGGRQIGVYALFADTPHRFNDNERQQFNTLVAQMAVTVESRRLFAEAQARAEQERRVRTITDKIRRGTDREAILRIAQKEIAELLGASSSVVQLGTQAQLLSRMKRPSPDQPNE